MIIIKHRINKIKELKNTNAKFGVEIDLRSRGDEIYLHHDPYIRGESFEKWIKFFKHKLIVLNVKEEGLENKITKILKKNKIFNYFFHDQTFSSMLKSSKFTKVSIRISEFEKIKNLKFILKKIKWVWIDHFTKFSLCQKDYNLIKKNRAKICIVSPELVSKRQYLKKIKNLKNKIKKRNFQIDAICTKYPKYWT